MTGNSTVGQTHRQRNKELYRCQWLENHPLDHQNCHCQRLVHLHTAGALCKQWAPGRITRVVEVDLATSHQHTLHDESYIYQPCQHFWEKLEGDKASPQRIKIFKVKMWRLWTDWLHYVHVTWPVIWHKLAKGCQSTDSGCGMWSKYTDFNRAFCCRTTIYLLKRANKQNLWPLE